MTPNPPHAPRPTPLTVVGLMSGTSADGIDAAVVEISGRPPELNWLLLAQSETSYPDELSERVFAAFRPQTATVDQLCSLNFALGEAFAHAAFQAIKAAGLTPDQVDLIGSHGQTVWHIADGPDASTLQLGEAAVIAERTGITTVSNFRTRDMAAGGQGAPLVSFLDALLLAHPTEPRAAQNIGGIANVTYLPPTQALSGDDAHPFAFDTGPGNMLIDDAIQRATGGALTYDDGGAFAASGTVNAGLLDELMREPYLAQPLPKTTGRELFGRQYGAQIWERGQELGLGHADLVATVTAFTAESIARAYHDFLPHKPESVFVSGGGALNRTLMKMLSDRLNPEGSIQTRVLTTDDAGLPADAKEAIAFAVFAYETWHGRPSNLPSATGATHAVSMGTITPGRLWPNRESGSSSTL